MPIGERGKITTITDLSGNTYDLGAKYDASGNNIESTYAKLTDIPDEGMVILSYGSSTWAEFKAAYDAKNIVYCRASSNSNPASGSQTRLAFMAYVDSAANPTNVEFQYYRSVSTHSDSQQGDQVYVYKLTNAGAWSVTVRENYTKIAAGKGLSGSWSNGVYTTKAALVSETNLTDAAEATTESSVNVYPVAPDSNGKLAVVVPDDKAFIATRIVTRSDMESLPYALSEGEIVFAEDEDGGLVLLRVLEDFSIGDTNFDVESGSAVETVGDILREYYDQIYGGSVERTSHKVTSLSSGSTDAQYPSAKAVYDEVHGLPELYSTAFDNVDMLATALTLDRGLYYFKATCTNRPVTTANKGFHAYVNRRATGNNEIVSVLATQYDTGDTYVNVYDGTASTPAWNGWAKFISSLGDTMSDWLYVAKNGTTGVRVSNTDSTYGHSVDVISNSLNGAAGLYDRTNNKWMIYSDNTGKIVIPTHLPLTGGLECAMTGYLYIKNSNVTKGTNPSSDSGRAIRVMHSGAGTSYSGNDVLGQLGFIVTSSGVSQANLMAYKNVANTAHWAALRAQISSDGTAAPYFVTNTNTSVVNVIWHAGNLPGVVNAYSNASINSSISISNTICQGYVDNSSKRVTFHIPYNVIDGTASCSSLSVRIYLPTGGNPYFRSGTNGGTYTQDNSVLSIWANSATKRTNEVTSVACGVRVRSGFNVQINFNYAMTTNNTGTSVTSGIPVSVVASGTFALT